MKIEFLIAWYDLWIGIFIDRKKRSVYILPLPCIGFILRFGYMGLHDFFGDGKYPCQDLKYVIDVDIWHITWLLETNKLFIDKKAKKYYENRLKIN